MQSPRNQDTLKWQAVPWEMLPFPQTGCSGAQRAHPLAAGLRNRPLSAIQCVTWKDDPFSQKAALKKKMPRGRRPTGEDHTPATQLAFCL